MTNIIIHPAFELDVKAISDAGEFEGVAAAFGNMDSGRDIIVKGAFEKSLKARPAAKVKVLYQNRSDQPIGIWTSLT